MESLKLLLVLKSVEIRDHSCYFFWRNCSSVVSCCDELEDLVVESLLGVLWNFSSRRVLHCIKHVFCAYIITGFLETGNHFLRFQGFTLTSRNFLISLRTFVSQALLCRLFSNVL